MTHYKISNKNTTKSGEHRYKCLDCGRLVSTQELEKWSTAIDAIYDLIKRVTLHHNHEHHEGCCIHLVSKILEDYEIVKHRSESERDDKA